MKKIILICCLIKVFIFTPVVALGQEDGWKSLKWGMTLQEVKTIYENEGQCNNIRRESHHSSDWLYGRDKSWVDIPPKTRDMLTDVWFMCHDPRFYVIDSQIFFYNNKFYGKRVYVDFEDATTHEIIIKQLKEKYPKGTVKRTFKYPIFEYISERITVFSTPSALYFYDTKMLNKILINIANEKRKEYELEQQKLKKLF